MNGEPPFIAVCVGDEVTAFGVRCRLPCRHSQCLTCRLAEQTSELAEVLKAFAERVDELVNVLDKMRLK